jgi:hypothetical protein
MADTYKIIRFYAQRGKEKDIINTGLTLEQAEAHCSRDDTHGDGWFDGREKENKTDEELLEQWNRDEALQTSAKKLDWMLR